MSDEQRIAGSVDGVLYCYGGCGRRYCDFGVDVILPNTLWNRIAVGWPFQEEPSSDWEGRGGVLCANCIVQRLGRLPEVTVALLTTDAEQQFELSTLRATLEAAERERDEQKRMLAESRRTLTTEIETLMEEKDAMRAENTALRQRLRELRQRLREPDPDPR